MAAQYSTEKNTLQEEMAEELQKYRDILKREREELQKTIGERSECL